MRRGIYGLGLALLALVVMKAAGFYLDNHASGWGALLAAFPAGDRELVYSRVPNRVAIVDPAGGYYEFGSGSRRSRRPAMEAGFDGTAFWVRTRPGETGPAGALYVPWASVRSCGAESAEVWREAADTRDALVLAGVEHGLQVWDEALVAACRAAAR
jgi:hypothetical protein